MALQYVDPFGTAKLVLFQVTSISDKTWRAFELVPWIILAIGGVSFIPFVQLSAYLQLTGCAWVHVDPAECTNCCLQAE